MSAFIINTNLNNVVGFVQNPQAADKAGENTIVVSSAKDLEVLSLQQLTDLYNVWVPAKEDGEKERITKFKIAKDKAAEKVFTVLEKIDLALLIQFDKQEEKIVEEQSKQVASQEVAGKKPRKERDSKLQKMKRAFLEKNEDGTYKRWTVKELMERCGTDERITKVYISILRSRSDRFVMDIEKEQASKDVPAIFFYAPKDEQKEAAIEQQAAV